MPIPIGCFNRNVIALIGSTHIILRDFQFYLQTHRNDGTCDLSFRFCCVAYVIKITNRKPAHQLVHCDRLSQKVGIGFVSFGMVLLCFALEFCYQSEPNQHRHASSNHKKNHENFLLTCLVWHKKCNFFVSSLRACWICISLLSIKLHSIKFTLERHSLFLSLSLLPCLSQTQKVCDGMNMNAMREFHYKQMKRNEVNVHWARAPFKLETQLDFNWNCNKHSYLNKETRWFRFIKKSS